MIDFWELIKFNAHRRPLVDVPVDPTPPPRDYYISLAGSGDGLTSGSPMGFATFIAATLNPGDQLFFNRGDQFELNAYDIEVPGVDINAFGTGDDPLFIGSEDISGLTWIDEGGDIWSASVATFPKWIFIGGVAARMAESDWIPVTNVISDQVRRVSAATINAFPDSIVGALMRGKEFSFRLTLELTVTAYNSTNGNITFAGTVPSTGLAIGMPIKLFNQLQFMQAEGDWVYDVGTTTLYVQSTVSPSTLDIRATNAEYGFYFNAVGDGSISNVEMKQYWHHALRSRNSDNLLVQSCSFNNNRSSAMRLYGNVAGTVVDDCDIFNNGLCGIENGALQGATFSNNRINNIGMQSSIGFPIDTKTGGTGITAVGEQAGSIALAANLVIEDNVIHTVGYQGVHIWGPDHIIRRNHIYNYCNKWTDGGGIHLFFQNLWAPSSTSGMLIEDNLIGIGVGNIDGIASGGGRILAGIYQDAGTNGNTFDQNFIYDPGDYGIFVNVHTTNTTITDNQISGGTIAGVEIRQELTPHASFPWTTNTDCVLTGNVIVTKFTPSRCLSLYNDDGTTNFNPFGGTGSIDNNHYANQYTTDVARRTSNASSFTQMSLAAWKTYIGSDAASTAYMNSLSGNTPVANHVEEELNYTNAPVNFNVPAGYEDVEGNAFSNPVSIPAYNGLIYLKETP